MKTQILLIVLIVLFNVSTASAQLPQIEEKTVKGGILNGKATSLSKPAYPAAARAVNAEGVVPVQVVIDEEGNVVSASAVSGHPLLRAAAEGAAKTSKFSPTTLQGAPVRVSGIIVYNFILPVSFTLVGYELSLAEKSLRLENRKAIFIAQSFPTSWTEEKKQLENLDSYLSGKAAAERKAEQAKAPAAAESSELQAKDYQGKVNSARTVGNVLTVEGSSSPVSVSYYALDADSVEVLRRLQSQIENRLSVNDKIVWSFRLGKILGRLKAEIETNQMEANVSELSQLQANIPAGISESVVKKTAEIVETSRQNASSAEKREKILALIGNLRSLRGL